MSDGVRDADIEIEMQGVAGGGGEFRGGGAAGLGGEGGLELDAVEELAGIETFVGDVERRGRGLGSREPVWAFRVEDADGRVLRRAARRRAEEQRAERAARQMTSEPAAGGWGRGSCSVTCAAKARGCVMTMPARLRSDIRPPGTKAFLWMKSGTNLPASRTETQRPMTAGEMGCSGQQDAGDDEEDAGDGAGANEMHALRLHIAHDAAARW